MNAEKVAKALGGAKRGKGGWWSCRCPAHDDKSPSLGLKDADDGGLIYTCQAGCAAKDIAAKLRAKGLLAEPAETEKKQGRGTHTDTYQYRDERGALLFEVWRYADPKGFAQRRPEPAQKSGWKWSLGDVRRVLYRLPELLAADPAAVVYVAEGEKDADRLRSHGLVATTNPQGAGKWQHTDRAALAGRHVVILPDNDPPGRQHIEAVARDLVGKAASVRILDLAGLPPKGDVSNWLDQGHTEGELQELAAAVPLFTDAGPSWRNQLLTTTTGRAYDAIQNGVVILRQDPALAGRLRWNAFRTAVEGRQLPWRPQSDWQDWANADDLLLTVWVQERGVLLKRSTVSDAVQAVAMDVQVHPILDRLGTLLWDGKPRLDTWLHTYLGVTDDADDAATMVQRRKYHQEVARKFLIAAIARISEPGCQADHALIFEGPQGVGKSSAAAILALDPAWFADEIAVLGTKDAAQDLRGKWLVELAELAALKRSEVERIKSFISRKVDHYRPSFERRSEDFGRQCAFVGSTNSSAYLADETGGRRFWPVKVGRIDLAALRRDAEQLWAEAMVAYRAGETWWLDKATEAAAAEEQKDRQQPDVWADAILAYLVGRASATVPDILANAIKMPVERQGQREENRVARVLIADGWERKRPMVNGLRRWTYFRPAEPDTGAKGPETGTKGTGLGQENPAFIQDVPVVPVVLVGFVHTESTPTANGHFHLHDSAPFQNAVSTGTTGTSGTGGTGANGCANEPCTICGRAVAVGQPGYAWTPEGHAHAACLSDEPGEDRPLP